MLKVLSLIAEKITTLLQPYISPYRAEKPPIDPIIIYNASSHANNVAITKLKEVWPDLTIIQCIVEGQQKHPLATHAIELPKSGGKDNFNNPELVYQKFLDLQKSEKSLRDKKAGLYCAWSAQAEDPDVAQGAIDAGFTWIGASPASMKTLGTKIAYKDFCRQIGVKSAPSFTLDTHNTPDQSHEAYVEELAAQFIAKYADSVLDGKACFIKSSFGGGGKGTLKITAEEIKNPEIVKAKLSTVIKDTRRTELYVEEALDLAGATLYQLELEVDGDKLTPGGRIVWFNPNNQKVLEIGMSDAQIEALIGKKVYAQAKAETILLAQKSGYNSRGTNEILLIKDKDNQWDFYHSEFNCRIQVEHEALGNLVTDHDGHPKNVPAEQVMRAAGIAPPTDTDIELSAHPYVVHLRLVNPHPDDTAPWQYNGGTITGHHGLPEGMEILITQGKLDKSTDAQFGRITFSADSWEELALKIAQLSQEFVILGDGGPIGLEYMSFLRKLTTDPRFIDNTLGCNQTSSVIHNSDVPMSQTARIAASLSGSVSDVLVNGYQSAYTPERGKTHPSTTTIQDAMAMKATLSDQPDFVSPAFQALVGDCKTGDPNLTQYYIKFKEELHIRGGGLNIVTRDTFQEGYGSQSAIVSDLTKLVMRKLGSVVCGFETGGAQFEKANIDGLGMPDTFKHGLLPNLVTRCLTRSQWLNSLVAKTPAEIALILDNIATTIKAEMVKMGVISSPADMPLVPWFPNNFHAGNYEPEQNVTTEAMLKAGMTPVPNIVWDPRFTEPQIREWVQSQIALFKQNRRNLQEIRIKNPGQQASWSVETIWHWVSIIREEFASSKLPDPIIHVHNHNINGRTSIIAHDLLTHAQKEGFRYLVVDVSASNTTHNDILEVSGALTYTEQERDQLRELNGCLTLAIDLTTRFDIRQTMKAVTPDDSVWAGGTGSSDYDSAVKVGLPIELITVAKMAAWHIVQLGGVVTPYSEILKRIGYTIFLNKGIQTTLLTAIKETALAQFASKPDLREEIEAWTLDSKTTLALLAKIGDELLTNETLKDVILACIRTHLMTENIGIDTGSLAVLQQWRTKLDRPEIVAQILQAHGWDPTPPTTTTHTTPPDLPALKKALQKKFQNVPITDDHVIMYLAYGASAETYLTHLNNATDLTWALSQPEVLLRAPADIHIGDTFQLHGRTLTLTENTLDEKTAYRTLKFKDETNTSYTIQKLDLKYGIEHGIIIPPIIVNEDDERRIGAPGEGRLSKLDPKFKKGYTITDADTRIPYAQYVITKTDVPAYIPKRFIGYTIATVHQENGADLSRNERVLTLNPPEPK